MQRRVGVSQDLESWARKVVRPYLPAEHRAFYAALPFVVVGARDASGRPWGSLLAGQPGFATAPDRARLQIAAQPSRGDALEGALVPGADVGILGIDLASRRRNRVNGRVRRNDAAGVLLDVGQTFGNCPQYITERAWVPAARPPAAPRPRRGRSITPALADRIRRADTCFIASGHRGEGDAESFGMDVSHRGGAAGFVTVEDTGTLFIPDYAGNNHFNTLGNLVVSPRAGLLFVDFEHGGLLQLTGRTEIEWDAAPELRSQGIERGIRFHVDETVWLEAALPLRWSAHAGARTLEVVTKVRESADVASFVLQSADGKPLPAYTAGQYLPLEVRPPAGSRPLARTYSLSGPPGAARYRISVKREPHGEASRHLHDLVEAGARLTAYAPAGDFVLEPGTRPVVLLSAGIGVTPLLGMLHAHAAENSRRSLWFVHGARNGREHAFAAEVRALAERHAAVHAHTAYSQSLPGDRQGRDYDSEGRVDAALLDSLLPDLDSDFYLCGPIAFMAELQAALETRGVAADRIRTEAFGPRR